MQPEVIAGRYEVIEQINDSNMAMVYRAFDRRDQRVVAIKRLKLLEDTDSRTRLIAHFRQEAYLLQRFHDAPHVVSLIDFNDQFNDYYIVMEYIGNSLRKMIKASGGNLPISLVVSIAYDLSRTLHKAHEDGIIHCDIKPSNVLITDGGIAKLADFGVAYTPNGLSRGIIHEGLAYGTPQYWAPEACRRAVKPNSKTDIWAFGVMLYELLTGEHPIPGLPLPTGQDPTNLIRRNEVIPIQNKRPDIPNSFAQLIGQMLTKDETRRVGSFDTISNKLRVIFKEITQHNLAPPEGQLSPPPVSQGIRTLLSTVVRQGANNEKKEWLRWIVGTALTLLALVFAFREIQLQQLQTDQAQQEKAVSQLQVTNQYLLESRLTLVAESVVQTQTSIAATQTAESTVVSIVPSHTPTPTLMPTPTDEPTSTPPPTLTPSTSPSPSPTPTPTTPVATFTPTAIHMALLDVSSLPCQAKVEDGKPFAEAYLEPAFGQPVVDRLSSTEAARVEEVLPDWIGINLHKKHVYVLDDQVQTYGDCDELFLYNPSRMAPKAITAEPTLAASPTPTPLPEPTPTPTRPRPTRLAPTQTPTDVPTPVYVSPPITQNPPADLPRVPTEQPAQPPAATNTTPPPTAVPQPTNTTPPPTDTPIPPNTPVPTTPPPDPTLPPSLPTNEPSPTPTRGIIIIGP